MEVYLLVSDVCSTCWFKYSSRQQGWDNDDEIRTTNLSLSSSSLTIRSTCDSHERWFKTTKPNSNVNGCHIDGPFSTETKKRPVESRLNHNHPVNIDWLLRLFVDRIYLVVLYRRLYQSHLDIPKALIQKRYDSQSVWKVPWLIIEGPLGNINSENGVATEHIWRKKGRISEKQSPWSEIGVFMDAIRNHLKRRSEALSLR